MYELETTNPTVFDHFKDNGFHVIRTSDRYWGDISTDLTIEQKLMRSVKTTRGLTRGKGMGEVQRTIWLFSTPICVEIKEALRNITGVSYETSEQHKETTLSRGKRDYKDASIIAENIVDRNPLQKSIDLISIETGEVADCSVNDYLANEIGEKIIQDMEGIPVLDYSFQTKDKAKVMNTSSNIKLNNEVVPVDPQLLFQRLLATVIRNNDIDMQQVFQYELSTSPASLFGEKDGLMRKADKPKLSAAIWKYVDLQMEHPKNASFVIDGGSLLQKIQGWPKGSTFKSMCKLYKDYVHKHYGGYDKPSTKDTTHLRRS